MSAMLEMGREVLAGQAFSVLLGTELARYEEGIAVLRLPVRDELRQQYGVVHGGVLSYLVDNAMAFAGGSVLEPVVFTSEFKINYLRPAVGEWLEATARVEQAGRSQAVCSCEVLAYEGESSRRCVIGQGTIVRSVAERGVAG